MSQTKLTTLHYAEVGGPISLELGTKMVKDFQDKYPAQQGCFGIGKNIIAEILSQPGCEGIKFYSAMDAQGKETLVYVGVDVKGNALMEYSIVGVEGKLRKVEAIIGDQTDPPTGPWW